MSVLLRGHIRRGQRTDEKISKMEMLVTFPDGFCGVVGKKKLEERMDDKTWKQNGDHSLDICSREELENRMIFVGGEWMWSLRRAIVKEGTPYRMFVC